MSDLVRRDDLWAAFQQMDEPTRKNVRDMIRDTEAVDAVGVIRCKDCKYGEEETNGNGEDMVMCTNKLNPIGFEDWLMPPEFYCANGERRENDDGS